MLFASLSLHTPLSLSLSLREIGFDEEQAVLLMLVFVVGAINMGRRAPLRMQQNLYSTGIYHRIILVRTSTYKYYYQQVTSCLLETTQNRCYRHVAQRFTRHEKILKGYLYCPI